VAVADLVGGETPDHFVDGVLEVGLAGGEWEGDGLAATAVPGWVPDRLAVWVVVVAEGFALERGRGTSVAPFEDVVQRVRMSLMTSMVLFMSTPPWGTFLRKV
jgi:hypothetical protein